VPEFLVDARKRRQLPFFVNAPAALNEDLVTRDVIAYFESTYRSCPDA
jgi:hypothetical protein